MYNQYHDGGGRGRGRGRTGYQHQPQYRRELRRPNLNPQMNQADELARSMANMDPFAAQGGNGFVYGDTSSTSGWSSGENNYDHMMQQQQQQQQQHHQQQPYGMRHPQHHQPRDRFHYRNPNYQLQHQQQLHMEQQQQHFQQQQLQQQLNWNLGASEFVPQNSNLSVGAMEFVPRSMARNTSQWAAYQGPEGGGWEGQHGQQQNVDPMEQLNSCVSTLIFSPGKFDKVTSELAEVFNAGITDKQMLKSVINTIMNSCLSEANFRYTGARLLDFLSNAVFVEIEGETFKSQLLEKCRSMHSTHSSLEAPRLRSLTFFMADLFLQLGDYSAGEGTKKRVPELGEQVLDLLSALVEKKDDKENLKTVAQTLKMSGGALEEEEKAKNSGASPKLDSLLEKAESIGKHVVKEGEEDPIPEHIRQMMSNLIDLRKAGWGKSSASAAATNEETKADKAATETEVVSSTPFCGDLTEEEIKFMREHLGDDFDGGGGDDFPEEDFDEMPPEIAAAFDEFLANQEEKAS